MQIFVGDKNLKQSFKKFILIKDSITLPILNCINLQMNKKSSLIEVLEEKIIGLLNKLKENHLILVKQEESQLILLEKNKSLEDKIMLLQEENKSLKIANNLLGSNEGKSQTKTKINGLIKEVDDCINQLSEMN